MKPLIADLNAFDALKLMKAGTETRLRIPMIATTVSISARLKPRSECLKPLRMEAPLTQRSCHAESGQQARSLSATCDFCRDPLRFVTAAESLRIVTQAAP